MKARCNQFQVLFDEYAAAKITLSNLEFELRCLEQEHNTWKIASVKPQVDNAVRILRGRKEAFTSHQQSGHGISPSI
jgi:hypothetical protein